MTPQDPGQGDGGPESGTPPENQQGQGGADEGDPQEGQSLADRQRALREELGRQQGLLPRLGNEAAEEARRRLDEAGRAMDRAEEALRQGDNGAAIDRQADAIEALREGLRALGEAFAQGQGRQQGESAEQRLGEAGNRGGAELPRDPLGRAIGEGSRIDTDQDLLAGEDVYRRARDLLDEIRRRSAERLRPDDELDYLRRLLDRF
jgi:hypothetical protein